MNKKQIGLIVLSELFLIAILLTIASIFDNGINLNLFLGALLISLLGSISLSFTNLFVEDWRIHLLLGVLTSAVLFLIFPQSPVQIISILALIAGLLMMQHAIIKRKKEFIHFSYYQVIKRGIALFLVALTVVASANVYIQTSESLRRNPAGFYAGIADAAVRSSESILRTQIEAGNREEAREILRVVVIQNLEKIFEPIPWLLPVLYAFVLFFSLRLIIPILSWLSAVTGKGIFNLLVRGGFIVLKEESVTVQTPALS